VSLSREWRCGDEIASAMENRRAGGNERMLVGINLAVTDKDQTGRVVGTITGEVVADETAAEGEGGVVRIIDIINGRLGPSLFANLL
jgi:hypothetical protein